MNRLQYRNKFFTIRCKAIFYFWRYYLIDFPGDKLILFQISGDIVLTDDIKKALDKFKPDITVVASGNASMDMGGDILMSMD